MIHSVNFYLISYGNLSKGELIALVFAPLVKLELYIRTI